MPDSFFVSTSKRKRKQSKTDQVDRSSSSKKSSKTTRLNGKLNGKSNGAHASTSSKRRQRDEELDSDATSEGEGIGDIDDLELRPSDEDPGASDQEEDEAETPAAKRLRLAQLYLDSVKNDLAEGDFDAAEIDREIISSRLQEEVLEHSGKIHKFIAEQIDLSSEAPSIRLKGHQYSLTGAVTSPTGQHIFSSSKDGSLIMWDLAKRNRIRVFRKQRLRTEPSEKAKGKQKATAADVEGHTDEVLALAISDDGRYLASGGKDRRVVIWDAVKGEFTKAFFGHKDSISALAFRANKSSLYSASLDRTIKLYDIAALAYVETLFGHQDHVVGLSALAQETAVSVGSRDRSARFWKVAEESQLVFRGGVKSKIREVLEGGLDGLEDMEEGAGPKDAASGRRFIEGSLECVAMVDETTFVTGGDSGSICVWSVQKKKPQFTQAAAHGMHEVESATEGVVSTPRWITSLACLRYSDLIASGSWDGSIRLWRLHLPNRGPREDSNSKPAGFSLSLIGELPARGFVNSLQFVNLPRSTEAPEWTRRPRGEADEASEQESQTRPAASHRGTVLLTVALGQEPRLGRWMRLSGEDGAQNVARVYALL